LVFVAEPQDLINSDPSLTKLAQIPAEVGRLEFKAFDSTCFERYAGLLALLKGLMGDQSLSGRATTPDTALHQHSARYGFDDMEINRLAHTALAAADRALEGDPDRDYLTQLKILEPNMKIFN
jgi:hypothetical protein